MTQGFGYLTYQLDRIFDQLELKWIALQAQKGKCICGEKVNLSTGELHHALISRRDVMNHPQKESIHHPYNCLLLHDLCHEKITRAESFKFLSTLYDREEIRQWYNRFVFKSDFRKLEAFEKEIE